MTGLGIVYKITHDKRMGRLAHIRMFGGEIKNRDALTLNPGTEEQKEGKITQIKSCFGSKLMDVGEAKRGDVVAVSGLTDARVYDIIGELTERTGCRLTEPTLRVQVIPPSPERLDETLSAFEELAAEDPKLGLQYFRTEREITVGIIGTIQLEILTALARERYGLEVRFSPPTVIYKETPAGPGHGFDAYTMPKPCWAIVELELEPGPRGSGLVYCSEIKDNIIPYRYQNHIGLSVPRALKQGLMNWEVTDLKVRLTGGGHHPIHTHPLDFFLCTPIAVMKALTDAGTTLLEPTQIMRIIAGEEHAGRIIGDMLDMRAEYDSPVIRDGKLSLEARVPVSASMDYAVRLAAATSGRGAVSARFGGYRECPEGLGEAAKRRGINPLDRDRWILANRGAMSTGDITM
jgi:ribosomal protection tetracycline resistance protein